MTAQAIHGRPRRTGAGSAGSVPLSAGSDMGRRFVSEFGGVEFDAPPGSPRLFYGASAQRRRGQTRGSAAPPQREQRTVSVPAGTEQGLPQSVQALNSGGDVGPGTESSA